MSSVSNTINTQNVVDTPVENENQALNVLVTFLSMAQSRGAFNLQESAKIWECVQKFNTVKTSPQNA
tara:strand:+ start:448 stop:648 length:201 start_codon:yes stop_codon:yes gene_type:complete